MSENSNVKFRLNNSELWGGLIGLALGIFVIRSGLKLKLGTIHDSTVRLYSIRADAAEGSSDSRPALGDF